MRSPADNVPDLLDRLEWLDDPAGAAQEKIKQAVPRSSPVGEALSGTWLGHPLHPLLTDVVLGSWTSSLVLDLVGGPKAQPAADKLVAVGILSALPTVAAGVSDWADVSGQARRTGVLHAAGNAAALALFTASLTARRRGCRRLGVGLSLLGAAAAATAGWLGSHLTYSLGVGVNEAAFESPPEDWTAIRGDAPAEGTMRRALASNVQVLLVTYEGKTRALLDRCSHRGCSLAEGTLEDGHVVCGCHGSTFALDGSVRRGPAFAPQPALDVRRTTAASRYARPADRREVCPGGQARRVRLACPEIDL